MRLLLYSNQNLPLLILSKPSESTNIVMPAYRSSSPSLFSSVSDSSQRQDLIGSPNVSFIDYIKLFNNNNSFTALQVALYKRQDLAIKTNEMKYLAELVEQLQDKANRQQEHIEEMFNSMETAGIHQILKKHFVQDNGVLRTQRGVEFNVPRTHKKYSLYRRRSTPYPPAMPSRYKSSSPDSLPAGEYQTISRYPLDGGFIHHYVRPAPLEPSTSTIIPKREPLPTIQAK